MNIKTNKNYTDIFFKTFSRFRCRILYEKMNCYMYLYVLIFLSLIDLYPKEFSSYILFQIYFIYFTYSYICATIDIVVSSVKINLLKIHLIHYYIAIKTINVICIRSKCLHIIYIVF